MEEESRPLADSLDAALRKYGKIWIWSILITAAATYFLRSTASLSILTRGAGRIPDPGAWIFITAGVIECVVTFLSLFWLFQFMRSEIFPIFFPAGETDNEPASDGAQLLYRAFGGLLVGLGAQAASYILLLVLRLGG